MSNTDSQTRVKRERPISPHLSVYKPQLTSVMSISHRISGAFILFGAFVFVLHLLSVASGPESCRCISAFISSSLGKIALILWLAAMYYHFYNGIRHLFWDLGYGLDIKKANNSGIFVIISTIISVLISIAIA